MTVSAQPVTSDAARAMTLVEVLLALMLTGSVIAGATTWLRIATSTEEQLAERVAQEQAAAGFFLRLAEVMEAVDRDEERDRRPHVSVDTTALTIRCRSLLRGGTSDIVIQLDGTSVVMTCMKSGSANLSVTLIDKVSALSFTPIYSDDDELQDTQATLVAVEISLTLSNHTPFVERLEVL